jgi:hypothetical protein
VKPGAWAKLLVQKKGGIFFQRAWAKKKGKKNWGQRGKEHFFGSFFWRPQENRKITAKKIALPNQITKLPWKTPKL